MLAHIVLLAAAVSAAPETYVLHAPHNVWDVAVHDFTGNGRGDILVLSCDETSYPLEKQASLYLADDQGAYPEKPSVSLVLPPDSGPLFLAETDGAAPKEIVVADAGGATIYAFEAGALVERGRPRFTSLLPGGVRKPSILRNVAIDLDGDGIDEWIVPVPLGVEVRQPGGEAVRVRCDIQSEASGGEGMYITHRVPAPHTFTIPGVDRKGIAFLSDEFADFAYGENWAQHQRFRIPLYLEEKWEARARMADINKDGWPDLMVTQTRGTVNLEVLTHVYIAAGPFAYPEEPSATFEAHGSIASGMLRDVNGNGYLDMIYIRVPFGMRNIINFVVRGKVRIDADVYLFDGLRYPDAPNHSASLTIDAPEGREQVAHALADFTGDGRLDLAIATNRDVLAIHAGEPNRLFSRSPSARVSVPSFGDARPYDLDGSGGQDLIIFRPDGPNSQRVEVLIF